MMMQQQQQTTFLLLKGFPAKHVDELRVYIAKMTIATDAHKELIDTLETLRDRFNAYSEDDRLNNPAAWAIQDEWKGKRLVLCRTKSEILYLTGRLLKITANDINLWPRHLKYQHPNGLDISAYDDDDVKPKLPLTETIIISSSSSPHNYCCCCVCLENVPNATFIGCGCSGSTSSRGPAATTTVCCTVCAGRLIRNLLNCPQCGEMVFDYIVTDHYE